MSDWDLIHRFAADQLSDSDDVRYLLDASVEQGLTALSGVLGGTIAAIASNMSAEAIIEVGTGVGSTTMRLAEACPDAHITSIDSEADHHVTLRELMSQVPLEPAKLRLITEKAQDVLGKMNDNSYDLVVMDVPPADAKECFDDAVGVCRPGGSILIARALVGGDIADPANRDSGVQAMRQLLAAISDDERVTHTLMPMAEGLIWVQLEPAAA